MADIRNQLAFHYRDDDNFVEAHWRRIPDNDPWDYYLSDLNVNSFFYASEMVINSVLIQLATPQDPALKPRHLSDEEFGFVELCNLNNEVSGNMLAVLGEFITAILFEVIPDIEAVEEEIGPPQKLSQLSLPFFWDEADYNALRIDGRKKIH